jgi:hypothetical protein
MLNEYKFTVAYRVIVWSQECVLVHSQNHVPYNKACLQHKHTHTDCLKKERELMCTRSLIHCTFSTHLQIWDHTIPHPILHPHHSNIHATIISCPIL